MKPADKPDQVVPAIPFGRHKGAPLESVPTGYLQWLCREAKLSNGLGAAVREELTRRKAPVPPPPEPKPRRCSYHPQAGIRASWLHQRDGRKVIRGECVECGAWVGALPVTPANVALADAGTNKAALLDLLTGCEDAGITVRRVGDSLQFTPGHKMTRGLWALERQCRGLLLSVLKDDANRSEAAP